MTEAGQASGRSTYLKGVLMSAGGMFVISPDGLILRLIRHAEEWDIVFLRSAGIFTSVMLFLAIRHGSALGLVVRSLGWPGVWASLALGGANLGFVLAMLNTTIANALVILATMPFFSAVIGWIAIRERVAPRTWASIAVALVGVVIIVSGSLGGGGLTGDLIALGTALCHGIALVQFRRLGNIDTTPVVGFGALCAALVAVPFANFAYTVHDAALILFQGCIQMPVALVLFTGGARFIAAAEVALFSLIETVLGPLWAWIGVGEVPGLLAIIGGMIVVSAVAGNAVLGLASQRKKDRQAGL